MSSPISILLVVGIKRYFIRGVSFNWEAVVTLLGLALGFYAFVSLLDWFRKRKSNT